MSPFCLALLALAGAIQPPDGEDSPPPRPAAGGSWELINQVQIIVNEDILTLRQLDSRVRRLLEVRPVSSAAQMRALRQEVAKRAAQDLLMVQRGRDLGFDPEFVKRTVDSHMREQAESAGGVSELAERLALRGETAAVRKESITDDLYAQTYERTITGQAPGPGGRPTRDRYVRPGILALGYGQIEQEPAALAAVGGRPETWVLQQLVLATAAFGGPEQAHDHVAGLREEALAGADFDELVATYSLVTENRGLSQPLTLVELRRLEPALERFCSTARVGDISEVLPILERGEPVYYRVLRLDERRPAQRPAFGDEGVQDVLRQLVLRNRDAQLREESLRELFRDSYLWESTRASGSGPGPGEGAERGEPGATEQPEQGPERSPAAAPPTADGPESPDSQGG